jgi:hypothetical protein
MSTITQSNESPDIPCSMMLNYQLTHNIQLNSIVKLILKISLQSQPKNSDSQINGYKFWMKGVKISMMLHILYIYIHLSQYSIFSIKYCHIQHLQYRYTYVARVFKLVVNTCTLAQRDRRANRRRHRVGTRQGKILVHRAA